jgi:hypothetical protein
LQLPPGQLSVQVEPFSHFMSQLPPAHVSLHPALPLDEHVNLQLPSEQLAFALAAPPLVAPPAVAPPLAAAPPDPLAGPPVMPACFGAFDFGTSDPVTALPFESVLSPDPDPDAEGSETSVDGLLASGAPFLTVQLDAASTKMARPDPVMCLIFMFHLVPRRGIPQRRGQSAWSVRRRPVSAIHWRTALYRKSRVW